MSTYMTDGMNIYTPNYVRILENSLINEVCKTWLHQWHVLLACILGQKEL